MQLLCLILYHQLPCDSKPLFSYKTFVINNIITWLGDLVDVSLIFLFFLREQSQPVTKAPDTRTVAHLVTGFLNATATCGGKGQILENIKIIGWVFDKKSGVQDNT